MDKISVYSAQLFRHANMAKLYVLGNNQLNRLFEIVFISHTQPNEKDHFAFKHCKKIQLFSFS